MIEVHISNAQIHRVLELHVHRVGGVQSASGAGAAERPDQLTLSRKATDMQEIKQQLTRLPDMRTGLVKDFKNKVQVGTYDVSEAEIAENMLATALQNRAGI
jgi:flagellar biosynthesis anti-sigma factor FlgM